MRPSPAGAGSGAVTGCAVNAWLKAHAPTSASHRQYGHTVSFASCRCRSRDQGPPVFHSGVDHEGRSAGRNGIALVRIDAPGRGTGNRLALGVGPLEGSAAPCVDSNPQVSLVPRTPRGTRVYGRARHADVEDGKRHDGRVARCDVPSRTGGRQTGELDREREVMRIRHLAGLEHHAPAACALVPASHLRCGTRISKLSGSIGHPFPCTHGYVMRTARWTTGVGGVLLAAA